MAMDTVSLYFIVLLINVNKKYGFKQPFSPFTAHLSDFTREFWRNYRYFEHQNRHSSRQTARVSETSKISKNSAQAIYIEVKIVRNVIFFEKHDSPERFFCKKSAYFHVFQPSVKMTFFCVSLEIMKSANYSTFRSIKTSLFFCFQMTFSLSIVIICPISYK